MNILSKVSSEVSNKFKDFLKKNKISLYNSTHGEHFPIEVDTTGKIVTNPQIFNGFFANRVVSYSNSKKHDDFINLLKSDIKDNWSDKLLINLYEKNENETVKRVILKDWDLIRRYLTYPKTLESVTLKNIGSFCKMIPDKENAHLFIKELMVHPNWVGRQEELKSFLLTTKNQITLHKLFNEDKKDVVEVSGPSTLSYELNLSLVKGLNNKGESLSHKEINTRLLSSISQFNSYKPQNYEVMGIFCNSNIPKNSIQTVAFLTYNKDFGHALAHTFFNTLKSRLQNNNSTDTGFEKANIQQTLSDVEVVYRKFMLEKTLSQKDNNLKLAKI